MILIEAYQGLECDRVIQVKNLDGTSAVNVFTIGSVPGATVWQGQNQAELFEPTVAWYTATNPAQTGYDQGQIALSITGDQTANLDPAGEYFGLVTETTAGVEAPIIEFRLKVIATPGSVSPTPPDLITYDYCMAQLTSVAMTDDQRSNIPYLVAAASEAARRVCFGRNFDLRTYAEFYNVELDGTVRLYQPPVQQVLRVQGSPAQALRIANTSQSVQFAQAYFSYSGVWNGYGLNSQTPTGMMLSATSSGILLNQSVLYTPAMTVSDLATAINALGGGWTATADSGLGAWPVTELDGGYVSQGCAIGAMPGDGALFSILRDLSNCSLDNERNGFLWVGRQASNSLAQRWGPGGYSFFGETGSNGQCGRVKVTYVAGSPVIPSKVQYLTAMLVKWYMETAKQELLLKSEKAADYAYELADQMVAEMPLTIRQGLSSFAIHYA